MNTGTASPKATDFEGLISIGSLPTVIELQSLFKQGIQHLVNVSGIKLAELYPEQNLACFNIHEFIFSDLFSKYDLINHVNELNQIDKSLFFEKFNPAQQIQFKIAVITTIQLLKEYRSVHVFCHHGVGRSPAVSFAAFHLLLQPSLLETLKVIESIRPQAKITTMTISSSYWLKDILFNEPSI